MILICGVVLVWLVSNGIGVAWTYAILGSPSLQSCLIQPDSARISDFHRRMPLVALNLLILLFVVLVSVGLYGGSISMEWKGWLAFGAQFVVFLLVDDLYFYLFHR